MKTKLSIVRSRRVWLLAITLALIVLIGNFAHQGADATASENPLASLAGPEVALADGSGQTETVEGAMCMQDNYYELGGQGSGPLTCSAGDVNLAAVTNVDVADGDGCDGVGDTVTFTADFQIDTTANQRFDVGLYIATEGQDNALTGECSISTPAYGGTATNNEPFYDGDQTTNSTQFTGYCSLDGGTTLANPNSPTPCNLRDENIGNNQCAAALGMGATCERFGSGIQDTCGDIKKPDNDPIFPTITQTVVCTDNDNDGKLDLPYCTSYRQSNQNASDNELCLTPLAAIPGAKSKCTCGTINVTDIDVPPPASTTIALFSAEGNESSIDVMWATVSEETTDYFNLYRSTSPDELGSQLNAQPIMAQNAGLPIGASYTFEDLDVLSGVQYFYTLEVWDIDGTAELNGPTMGVLNPPTAITLDTLSGTSPTAPLAGLLALGALMTLGAVALGRRTR